MPAQNKGGRQQACHLVPGFEHALVDVRHRSDALAVDRENLECCEFTTSP